MFAEDVALPVSIEYKMVHGYFQLCFRTGLKCYTDMSEKNWIISSSVATSQK